MTTLWIYDADDAVSPEDIERGCLVAEQLIESRGYSVEQAYAAVLARAHDEAYDRRAAKAWDEAEDAAMGEVFGAPDDWPDEPVLGLA